MSITTIVFDFGNVIGYFDHGRAARRLSAYTHLPPEAIVAAYVGTDFEDEFEEGRLSAAEFRDRLRKLCHLRCTDEEFDDAVSDIFWPNDDACALIPHLKRNHKVLLLSNTNAIHAERFRRDFAATLAHFDGLVLSHEARVRKPDPRIYHHARELAGAPPHACVFIDDLHTNVEAARACGWHGIVYRRGDCLRRHLEKLGIV
jgi:putative hydrolase of the HAD superfamily